MAMSSAPRRDGNPWREQGRGANQQPAKDFGKRLDVLEAKLFGSPSEPAGVGGFEQRVKELGRRLEGVEGKLGGVGNIHGLVRSVCKDEIRHAGEPSERYPRRSMVECHPRSKGRFEAV